MDELINEMLMFRAKHNMSQKEFADMCGLTRATIWNAESGKSNPTPLTKAKIKAVIEKGEAYDQN